MNPRVKQIFILMSVLLLVAVTAIGCGNSGSELPVGLVKSALARDMTPESSDGDLEELVSGNTAFALDMYHQLQEEEGNLFFSPYSISLALAMTYAGARGETETQMSETLQFTLSQEELHQAFNALDIALASRGENVEGQDGEPFRLNIANSLWGQEDYEFLSDFLDVLAENYGAGFNVLDFMTEPEEARGIINSWVEEQTEDKIKDILPEGSIHDLTRLVLTNAIYFNAAWAHEFEEDATRDRPFHLPDGSQVTVSMMSQAENFEYAEGDAYQAIEVPYDGEELSMVVIMPESGHFEEFEDSLDPEKLRSILSRLAATEVAFSMPKFEYESDSVSLASTLSDMGMPQAFSGAADFSGIDGTGQLFIKDVIHKAFISVNESGTEAAASTAVNMQLKGAPDIIATMIVDHPFIYLIRDIETGSVLFLGRMMNPGS